MSGFVLFCGYENNALNLKYWIWKQSIFWVENVLLMVFLFLSVVLSFQFIYSPLTSVMTLSLTGYLVQYLVKNCTYIYIYIYIYLLQGYIPYPHIAAVCMFELVVLLLLGHMWGSIGVHHLSFSINLSFYLDYFVINFFSLSLYMCVCMYIYVHLFICILM